MKQFVFGRDYYLITDAALQDCFTDPSWLLKQLAEMIDTSETNQADSNDRANQPK